MLEIKDIDDRIRLLEDRFGDEDYEVEFLVVYVWISDGQLDISEVWVYLMIGRELECQRLWLVWVTGIRYLDDLAE